MILDRTKPYYKQAKEDRDAYDQMIYDDLDDWLKNEEDRENFGEEVTYGQVADCEVAEDFSEFEFAEELAEFEFAEEIAEFEFSGETMDFEIIEGAVNYFDIVQVFADHKDDRKLEKFEESADMDYSLAEEEEAIKYYSQINK
ncbi:hypothetical protein ABG067_008226 [Albugo candida]